MNNGAPAERLREFSQKEVDTFFKKIGREDKNYSPNLAPETNRDPSSGWITTSGSTKQSNKLIKVSAWQTGQAS